MAESGTYYPGIQRPSVINNWTFTVSNDNNICSSNSHSCATRKEQRHVTRAQTQGRQGVLDRKRFLPMNTERN
jgi:hypothetical protein